MQEVKHLAVIVTLLHKQPWAVFLGRESVALGAYDHGLNTRKGGYTICQA